MTMRHAIAILSFAGLAIITPATSLFAQQQPQPLPYRFLIPEGYVGWIRVDFDVDGAAALPVEVGFYVLKFPESGRLRTSSHDVVESRRNEFFYYSSDGKYRIHLGGRLDQRLVQEEFSGPGRGHRAPVPNHYRYFFIGPTDAFGEYQASDAKQQPREADGYPKVGARKWLTRDDLTRMRVERHVP
jgi:hypothetical protein